MPSPLSRPEGADCLANLQRLIAARWPVLASMALLVAGAPPLLAIPLPRLPLLAVLGLAAVCNLLLRLRLRHSDSASAGELFSQLAFDIASLGALLFFSGGATNPLVSLLLLPVAVAALTLPGRLVFASGALAIAAYSLLMLFYLPLPLPDAARATQLHLIGMWLTFVVSTGLIGWFVLRMTTLIRSRDAELAAARELAMRDERVLALGTLAAGAAHELGTPLATMAVLAGELLHDPGLPAAAREDIALLRQQVAACKEIITGLSRRAGAERLVQAACLRVDHWLDGVRRRWQSLRPQASCTLTMRGGGEPPTLLADPTLEQALTNLLNNAADTGGALIELSADWRTGRLVVEIRDHGPGFAPDILERAGMTPFPAHAGGSGIGLMLTRSAIERLAGRLILNNHPGGGAVARIELPLESP